MIDANFRAKSKDRGFSDIELAPGWSYYVEETKYQAHVYAARARKRKEVIEAYSSDLLAEIDLL